MDGAVPQLSGLISLAIVRSDRRGTSRPRSRATSAWVSRIILAALWCWILPTSPSASNAADLASLAIGVDSLHAAGAYLQADSLARIGMDQARDILPPGSLDLADWYNRTGRAAFTAGASDTALAYFTQAQTMANRLGDSGKLCALVSLRGLRDLAIDRSDIDRAQETARLCLNDAKQLCGSDSPKLAGDIASLAGALVLQDRIDEAEDLLADSISDFEASFGSEHPDLGVLIQEYALLALRRGHHAEARARYERALTLREAALGPDHPELTPALGGLAITLRQMGDFAAARALYERCLHIRTQAYGPDHPRVATTLHNLGVLLDHIGDIDGGAMMLERCLDIREKAFGEENAEVALTLIALSSTLNQLGRPAESVKLCRRGIAIAEKVFGPEHTQTARAIGRLAHIMQQQQNYEEANRLLDRCYAITEAIYGPSHPALVSYLSMQAWNQHLLGHRTEAREAAERAIKSAKSMYGREHYKVAVHKRDLARMYLEWGEIDQARHLLEESERTLSKALGPDHAALIRVHTGLAWISLQEKRLAEARDHAARAIEIARAAHGGPHFDDVGLLQVAALIERMAGNQEKSLTLAREASRVALDMQAEIYPVSSESEALNYARLSLHAARFLMGLFAESQTTSAATLDSTFSLLADTHGQVLDRMAQRQRLRDFCTREDPALCECWDTYRRAARRLANLVVRGPTRGAANYQDRLSIARREKETSEQALAEASAAVFRPTPAIETQVAIRASQVAGRLEPGTRLIQFIHYPDLDFTWQTWESHARAPHLGSFETGARHYAAFCLTNNDVGTDFDLQFVDLGSATLIDSLVLEYQETIDAVSAGRRPTPREEAHWRQAARRLYTLIWAPLAKAFGDHSAEAQPAEVPLTLVIPAAQLHWIDFGTLLDENEHPLIETHRIHWLSSVRDVERFSRPDSSPSGSGLLAVGNPGRLESESNLVSMSAPAQRTATQRLCLEALQTLPPLPAAEKEVRTAAELYTQQTGRPASILVGEAAREDVVKAQLSGKQVLHFATHGFFCPSSESNDPNAQVIAENPLLSSGLILAPSSSEEDGLLTALELAGQDLYGTDLVILSACGSGLGRMHPGEGLCGLRRAFEMAGARTVVMALWRIDDNVASDLIIRLYRHRLAGASVVDAVRDAALDRLHEQWIRSHRLHPAQWGGVISEGAWR